MKQIGNYTVKTEWSEVTLNEFTSFTDDPLYNLMIITNIELSEFLKLKQKQISELFKAAKFLKTKPEPILEHTVKIGNEEIEFMPDIRNQPLARWIAIEALLYKKKQLIDIINEGSAEFIPHVLSLMVVDKEFGFNQNKIMDYHVQILEMSVPNALGLYLFFLKLFQTSRLNLQIYINQTRILQRSKRTSLKSGIGLES